VEQLFRLKVADVRTANQVGKPSPPRTVLRYRSDWKKAYVTLKVGQRDAGVHRDLTENIHHADEKVQSDGADAPVYHQRYPRTRITRERPEKSLVEG